MTKIIWMSDLHFKAAGAVMDRNPRTWLRGAVDHINALYGDADYCVISGDLVDHGTAQGYAALRGELDRLELPFYPMVGNHDDRAELKRGLPVPEAGMSGFVQYAIPSDGVRVLCLDTLKPGASSGELCRARLEWLETELQGNRAPTCIFMHHPPMALGLPMQDLDNLEAPERFLDIIKRAGNVAYLFVGHVHRPVTGAIRGVPFATMRSVLLQAPAPRPAWDWDSFKPAPEAPAFGVIDITGDVVTLQYIEFSEAS